MLAGAPSGSMVWGGVGSSTGMGYIGIQLFSAKMKLAGAPPGSEVWVGVGAWPGMGYIGIKLENRVLSEISMGSRIYRLTSVCRDLDYSYFS